MNGDLKITASEALRENRAELVVTVKMVRDWRFRLGLWLIKMGCKIIGIRAKVDVAS